MKVSLRTYGGLMGGLGQPAHVIDDADLDDSDKVELRRLVAAAAASPAHPQSTEQLRDAQTYEIEIDDHGKLVTLEQPMAVCRRLSPNCATGCATTEVGRLGARAAQRWLQ